MATFFLGHFPPSYFLGPLAALVKIIYNTNDEMYFCSKHKKIYHFIGKVITSLRKLFKSCTTKYHMGASSSMYWCTLWESQGGGFGA